MSKITVSDTIKAYQNVSGISQTWGAVFNHNIKEIENKNLLKELTKEFTVGIEMKVLPEFCRNNLMEGGALITLVDNVTNLCVSHFFPYTLRLTVSLQILNKKKIYQDEKIYLIAKIDGSTKDYISVSCKIYNEKLNFVCRGQQIMSLIKNEKLIKKMMNTYSKK